MKRDIMEFINELADYINTHIVGTENTYIAKCEARHMPMNRGHAIPIKMKLPESMSEGNSGFGPCYYAEELLKEFPGSSVAAIAEILNVRVTEQYPAMLQLLAAKTKAVEKGINDYDRKDLIIAACPSSHILDENRNVFITKELPEIGITASIKAAMYTNPEDKNQIYYTPIVKKEGHEVTDEDWGIADLNTLEATDIKIGCYSVPHNEEEQYVSGKILDANGFYDYFYLLSPKLIWDEFAKVVETEKIYIIPESPYEATFLIDNPELRESQTAKVFANMFNERAARLLNNEVAPVVLDCNTMTMRRLTLEDINQ